MASGHQNLFESRGRDLDTGEISFWRHAWGNLRNAIIGCSAAVVFGLVVLLMSILSVTNPSSVFPQDSSSPAAEIVPTPTPIDYYLAYPGVLPDSPIYKVKVVRDRLWLWLTWDEVTKARRELLYADKRINAALALVEGGKPGLGVSTATKAEKYLQRAVERVVRLKRLGRDVASDLEILTKAAAKHTEVLETLILNTSGGDRVGLENTLKLARILLEQVAQARRE